MSQQTVSLFVTENIINRLKTDNIKADHGIFSGKNTFFVLADNSLHCITKRIVL